MGLEQAACV